MFALGSFAVATGGGFNIVDPDDERDPPTAPTPVTFPQIEPCPTRKWTEADPPADLQSTFSQVVRPSDVSSRQLEALNIELLPNSTTEELVYPSSIMSIESRMATPQLRKELDVRLTELELDNHSAYCIIQSHSPQPGAKTQRLAYMRKFYEGLESMGRYWDCSLDQHYNVLSRSPAGSVNSSERKRQRIWDRSRKSSESTKSSDRKKQKPSRKDSVVEASDPQDSDSNSARSLSSSPEPRPMIRYKGLRTGTGRDMPDSFRFNTVKGFVEQAVWPFKANVAPPRRQPLVQINHLNLPVRQSAMIHRVPNDREKARCGFIEGPIMGIQVRHDLEFSTECTDGKALLDQMREIGGLLQLAQERRRQGRREGKAGEGKWWTTKPRFGAASAADLSAAGDEERNGALSVVEEIMMGTREKGASWRSAPVQKRTPITMWEELRPASEKWDPRTEYQAIGKDPTSDYDEVFMISSLNHHISILKLTVHDAYMEHLETATLPDPMPSQSNWCRPRLQRSQWFDIFDVDQRVQAFKAIVNVMAYLTRETTKQ